MFLDDNDRNLKLKLTVEGCSGGVKLALILCLLPL